MPDSGPKTPPAGSLTWAALLAKWTELAQASAAIPRTEEGERWRSSVAPLIGLQGVTMALRELGLLGPGYWAAARDMSAVLISRHASELSEVWRGVPLPEVLLEATGDARAALDESRWMALEWCVGIDELAMPDLNDWLVGLAGGPFEGDVYVVAPGTLLLRETPAVAIVDPGDIALSLGVPGLDQSAEAIPMRQVYRRADEGTGEVVEDVIAPMASALEAGMPLLRKVVTRGRRTGAKTFSG